MKYTRFYALYRYVADVQLLVNVTTYNNTHATHKKNKLQRVKTRE